MEKNKPAHNHITNATGQLQAIEAQAAKLQKIVLQDTPIEAAELSVLTTACKNTAHSLLSTMKDKFLSERMENLHRHIALLVGILGS